MSTIRSLLIERLNTKIYRLRRAKLKLQNRSLEDKKLEHQINRLVAIRDRLRKKDSTDDQGFVSPQPTTPDHP